MEKINSNPLQKHTVIQNNHELIFTLSSENLRIDVEDMGPSSKIFSKIINPGEISSISNVIFNDLEAIYQGLVDGISSKDPAFQVSFIDGGKLSYNWKSKMGNQKINFHFEIQLKEIELDSTRLTEKKIEMLTKKIQDQEARIEILENENRLLKSGMEARSIERKEEISKKDITGLSNLIKEMFQQKDKTKLLD